MVHFDCIIFGLIWIYPDVMVRNVVLRFKMNVQAVEILSKYWNNTNILAVVELSKLVFVRKHVPLVIWKKSVLLYIHIYHLGRTHDCFFHSLICFTTYYWTVRRETNPIEVRGTHKKTSFDSRNFIYQWGRKIYFRKSHIWYNQVTTELYPVCLVFELAVNVASLLQRFWYHYLEQLHFSAVGLVAFLWSKVCDSVLLL